MRLLAAFIPAGLITLVLFALMQYLITSGRQPLAPPAHTGFVNLIRLHTERVVADTPSTHSAPGRRQLSADTPPLPETLTTEVEPPRPSALAIAVSEPPPPELAGGPYLGVFEPPALAAKVKPPAQQVVQGGQADSSSVLTPAHTAGGARPAAVNAAGLAPGFNVTGKGDGDPIPLLRIEPAYPRKAARNRKEGWVKVAFTITEQGTVIDPVVLESRPRRLFNRSAMAAIRKWRFRPKVVDGTPVPTRATQLIEFTLAAGGPR